MKRGISSLFALLVCAGAIGCGPDVREEPTDILMAESENALRAGKWERVVAFNDEIIHRTGGDYHSFLQRGVAHEKLGSIDGAIDDYGRAIDVSPQASAPRIYRASLNLSRGNIEGARVDLEVLNGIPGLEPHDRLVVDGLHGQMYAAEGNNYAAIDAYGRALSVANQHPRLWTTAPYRHALYNASEAYYQLGHFERALQVYQRYVDANDKLGISMTVEDHYNLGILAYLNGDFDQAREHLARCPTERRDQAADVLNDPSLREL